MNQGCAGSTADQWNAGKPSVSLAATAQTATSGEGNFSHVLVSLGGNDFEQSVCAGKTMTRADLTAKLTTIVSKVNAALPEAHIFATGYCQLGGPIGEASGPCGSPGLITTLNGAVQDAIAAAAAARPGKATYIDITDTCGGTPTQWSPCTATDGYQCTAEEAYMQDIMHLNGKGYCKVPGAPQALPSRDTTRGEVVTKPAIQTLLGCTAPSEAYDCSTVSITRSAVNPITEGGTTCTTGSFSLFFHETSTWYQFL